MGKRDGVDSMEVVLPATSTLEGVVDDKLNATTSKIQDRQQSTTATRNASYVPQFQLESSLILDRIKRGSHDNNNNQHQPNSLSSSTGHVIHLDNAHEAKSQIQLPRELGSDHTAAAPDIDMRGPRKPDSTNKQVFDPAQNTVFFPESISTPTTMPSHHKPVNSSHGSSQDSRTHDIERIRQKLLTALSTSGKKSELALGFTPGSASDEALAQYFNTMSKPDLLILLSFCDQLKPHLLVDIMVSIAKRHPGLPIFNSPDWNYHHHNSSSGISISGSQLPPRPLKRSAPGRPPHGRSLLNSKAKQKIKASGPLTITTTPTPTSTRSLLKQIVINNISSSNSSSNKKPLKRLRLMAAAIVNNDNEDDDDDDEEEGEEMMTVHDLLPPTWPEAGQGLYAELVSEMEDRGVLADENDEEAFSQFMVSKMGRQVIDPV